jgi:ubiquinone/menaquinone biosynthesis C-methylase UbiE
MSSDPHHTHSASTDDGYEEARYEHWQHQPEHFAAFYEKPSPMSPSGIVAHFLEARTAALEEFLNLQQDNRLLDVGCGSGIHMIRFVDRCAFVAGVDYSDAMLEIARRTLESTGQKNWELKTSDAGKLPYPDASFDAVIAMGLLDYVPDALEVLKEFARVLKPGGQAIVTIPKTPSIFSPLRSRLGNFIKRHVFNLPPVGNVQTRSSVTVLLENAGYRVEAVRPIWTAMWMVKARTAYVPLKTAEAR